MNRHSYQPPRIAAFETNVERGFAISTQYGIEDWETDEF